MNRLEQSPMDKTYRFWIYRNGTNVRLSLKVGHTHTLISGGPNEEGYHWEEVRYHICQERGILIREHAYESRDCDGRMSGGGESYAHLDKLAAKPKPWINLQQPTRLEQHELDSRPVHYPNWERLDDWRRDHQAEAAGF